MNFLTVVVMLPPIMLLIGVGIWLLHKGQRSLHVQLDGRLSELVELTRALALKEGIDIGRKQVTDEHALRDLPPKKDPSAGIARPK